MPRHAQEGEVSDAPPDADRQVIGYGKLALVWLALLALTVVTVLVSRIGPEWSRVSIGLGVASAKAGLVIAYFMHMRSEGRLLRLLLFVTLATIAVFIGFTFFDVRYR